MHARPESPTLRLRMKAKGNPQTPGRVQLPKDALKRIHLGQAFAEYDAMLDDPNVFVRTPASLAALDPDRGITFFVGRRGTGKTAITYFVENHSRRTVLIHPSIFSPFSLNLQTKEFKNPRQKPYRSLVAAFQRALTDEILKEYINEHPAAINRLPSELATEYGQFGELDFDQRVVRLINELIGAITNQSESRWLYEIKRPRTLTAAMNEAIVAPHSGYALLIDRIDDYWDGTDEAVILLTALMHGSAHLNAELESGRALVFLRENVFERVRAVDPEFARLETGVVGLDWTQEQLQELIERRFNKPLNTKLALGGPTWDHFFENPQEARSIIFECCQNRPRDVLIYCSFAIEAAQSHNKARIEVEDIQSARRRFSDSRLKDLGDEYAENFPQLALVLSRFYGLGRRFALSGVDSLLKTLLADAEVAHSCSLWIYNNSTPELFVRLLYNIGFVGLVTRRGIIYRSVGPRDTTPPPIEATTDVIIHPSYWDALDLQDVLITTIGSELPYGRAGYVSDLPGGLDLGSYFEQLEKLMAELEALPVGRQGAKAYEEIVGEVLHLCFFRSLTNPEAHSRTVDGRVVRDWVVSNRAASGFWEMVRLRYAATQVVWECKNYADVNAEDLHQVSYYLNDRFGRFGVLVHRGKGSVSQAVLQHIQRIASDKNALVLVLHDRDLMVFLRQARNGKIKEDHIQNRYDEIVRRIG